MGKISPYQLALMEGYEPEQITSSILDFMKDIYSGHLGQGVIIDPDEYRLPEDEDYWSSTFTQFDPHNEPGSTKVERFTDPDYSKSDPFSESEIV
jgi:hypothetical protein